MSYSPHFPQLIGAPPPRRGRKAGGKSTDLLTSDQDPFPDPPSSPWDDTIWKVLRNRSDTSSNESPCPGSRARAWVQLLRALHEPCTRGPGACCGYTQLAQRPRNKYLLHLPHPHARAGQVGLKSGCLDSAGCNQFSRGQQLSDEQMTLTWVQAQLGSSAPVWPWGNCFSLRVFPLSPIKRDQQRPARALRSFSHFSLLVLNLYHKVNGCKTHTKQMGVLMNYLKTNTFVTITKVNKIELPSTHLPNSLQVPLSNGALSLPLQLTSRSDFVIIFLQCFVFIT